ncbi:SNF2 family N-terminal domain-containing protein [Xylaria bambusicola]|uniref:SNF2 family N-terminal domain-containing protein n=1 Tax=Xylaria bambusicola TaxID=326684 RepID=UPI002008D241|nr:SNF2 family N-terminal domain-containing protein [Xylaria bambusicola]KAI0505120.1 SNF2 family N-terminal domain-containing protein [Xylaria bambusicola]
MTSTASSPSAAPPHSIASSNIATPQHQQHQPEASTNTTDHSQKDNGNNYMLLTESAANANQNSEEAAPPANQADGKNQGKHDAPEADSAERPSKRRRVREATPPRSIRRPKPESPPWKKVEAEGPTTFLEDGKRRSGRTNALPLELQPPSARRVTRGARNVAQYSPSSKPVNTIQKRLSTTPRPSTKQPPPPASRSSARKSLSNTPKPSTKTKSVAAPSKPLVETPKRALPTRRSSRTRRDSTDIPARAPEPLESPPSSRTTRIRLRVKTIAMPIVHPAQVNVFPGQTIPRPKVASSFNEYIAQAPTLDVRDGGWMDATDDGPPYTQEMAEKDARIILRIEKEVEPGGLLSEGRSSLFAPDPVEEPPRQWAHMDHLVKQMANFRKLMVIEHHRHKATAKKLAEACRDEWLRRQPKTAEEIEAEARSECISHYKIVVRALVGTWDNVKTEINRKRLEEWEAAEQRRVKAALNEAVSMSELKLQARRTHVDSDMLSDEDEEEEDEELEGSEDGDDDDMDLGPNRDSQSNASSANDEDNMTSSDDEEDLKSTISDEGLTQDQLRQKYANIPDLSSPEAGEGMQTEDPADTTDESVDMDDDTTSSDESMQSADESDNASDDESSDEEASTGLLGLFFGKKELKNLKDDAGTDGSQPALADLPATEVTDPAANDTNIDITQNLEDDKILSMNNADIAPLLPPVNHIGGEQKGEPPVTDACNGVSASVTDSSSSAVVFPCGPDITNRPEPSAVTPLSLQPRDGELNVVDAVEFVSKSGSHPRAELFVQKQPTAAAVPSIEPVPVQADRPRPISETDAITNSISRDRTQSPRTSETKPSDVDTASSVTKSGVSRSTTPPSRVPKTEVPFLLRGSLREYQHYGLDWLAGLYKNQTNGILADEMGLGKTIQTIALLAHLACHHEVWGPHLVIVPTSVMLNWEMEFKKWCPGFKVLSYYGSIEERKRKRQGWKTDDIWNVCITSYQIVLQDQQVFKRRQWHYMILDEAHNIKNFKSKRWQTLLGFNTQARLLLTGTPLQNNLTELWSLLFFLMPSENGVGGFADLAEFQDWFHKPESQILESGREQMDDEARAIIAKLHKVLRPYLLRRLKADVEKQMPAKYEHVELCRLSRRQRELYDGFLARTDTREALASGNYISVINCLMQLRKVCNHPDLFVERPIMTSFRQPTSVVSQFASTEALLRWKFLGQPSMAVPNLGFLNLIPTQYENLSATVCDRIFELSSDRTFLELQETQTARAQTAETTFDPSTVESNIAYIDTLGRIGRLDELRHCVYVNGLRRQQHPIYGKRLTDFLTLDINRRPFKPRPKIPQKIMSWFEEDSQALRSIVPTLDERSASMRAVISKFACITPAVVTRDLDQFVLGSKKIEVLGDMSLTLSTPVRYSPFMPKQPPLDPWHESRMRLSIQFPDKRLLQYDCGKLQVLDRLLRKLQSGGHRALIFTQMTKVLDVLEQFLNIHGHKYLRLDGATKVEQRQILTDRFNHDPRILCFILSTRSGGLGINLTGADTVIFYDQDWNPAMDKQCQDRCHRIGQTRDVHIYRLVSEHTIEANILRKASQKQMLDDIVIQEGGFTTDYFNKLSVRDVIGGATDEADVVGDAMDRVLGRVENADQRTVGRVLEQAEDREDVAAAHVAEKEIHEDEADFAEKPPTTNVSGASSTRQGTPAAQDDHGVGRSNLGLFSESADADDSAQEIEMNAWGKRIHTIDDYMLAAMGRELEGTALELPKDKKKSKSKKGKDTRKR